MPTDDVVANTRKGKQVLNVDAPARRVVCAAAEGDHVAVVGENRKLLVFPLDQLPEMRRGKGVRLQRYKDGGLSDAKVFTLEDGLTWKDTSGRTWTVARTTCATGSATAPKPAACRRRVSRSRTGSAGRSRYGAGPCRSAPTHCDGAGRQSKVRRLPVLRSAGPVSRPAPSLAAAAAPAA